MTLGQKSCKSSVNLDLPLPPLTGTTDKVTTLTTPEDTSFPGITASTLPGTSSLKSEKPDQNVLVPLTPSTGQVRNHNLRKCSVSITRLTTADIMKYTRASMVKLKATVTHSKDPTSTKHTDQWHKVPKHKISGHPQSNKHVFHVKHHILCNHTRKYITLLVLTGIINMNTNNLPTPAQDVTNLLYSIASYSSIEGCISNINCTGASTVSAPKAISTHKT